MSHTTKIQYSCWIFRAILKNKYYKSFFFLKVNKTLFLSNSFISKEMKLLAGTFFYFFYFYYITFLCFLGYTMLFLKSSTKMILLNSNSIYILCFNGLQTKNVQLYSINIYLYVCKYIYT